MAESDGVKAFVARKCRLIGRKLCRRQVPQGQSAGTTLMGGRRERVRKKGKQANKHVPFSLLVSQIYVL